jgi:hypothetical protein
MVMSRAELEEVRDFYSFGAAHEKRHAAASFVIAAGFTVMYASSMALVAEGRVLFGLGASLASAIMSGAYFESGADELVDSASLESLAAERQRQIDQLDQAA